MTFPIDNTKLVSVSKCDLQYILQHVKGWRRVRSAASEAMDAGTVLHDGMESAFREGTLEKCERAVEEKHGELFGKASPEKPQYHIMNLLNLFQIWWERSKGFRDSMEFISAEETTGIPLTPEITFYAKRDAVVRVNGQVVPLDHKTTGKALANFAYDKGHSSQFIGYCWATGKEYGIDCRTLWLNVLQVKQLPVGMTVCPTHKMSKNLCRERHWEGFIQPVEFHPATLRAWRLWAIRTARKAMGLEIAFADMPLEEIFQLDWLLGGFPSNCKWCDFADFCKFGRQEGMWEGRFVEERWEPWKEGKGIKE